ncbi:Bud site selection protein 6, partial [Linderina macrospora]
MNRNQGGYSFSTHSPEPSEYTAAMSTGDRMTPRRPPSGPRTGQPGGFGNGSLRTTRSSGGAFARTNQPSLPRVRTGTMQRRPIYDAPTSPYDRTPDYTSPTGGSGFQPYIPDGGDRRTPELHAATRTIDYSYNEAPMDGAGGIRRYRVDGHMSPYEPAMAGEEGRHVVGSARLMAGRSEMQGVSQRVEFGYTAPAPRATYAHSDSSEHDEIAEIIADMSKAQMPAGVVDLGDDRHVYLQLGEDTKRVRLPEPVTQTTLIQLFIEKYRARLAEEVNTLPSIYIKDPVSGHFYELEEMADVVDGSVLSWRAQPTQPTAAASTAAAEPKKQEEEEEEKVPSAMQAQIEGLAEIVRALADSVAKLPEQLRGELATAVGSVNEQILAQNARVDAALTAASSAAAAAAAAAAKSKANSDDKPATKSAPVSTEGSSEELSEQLASALKRLDAAELALGVERQERRET